MAVADRRLHRDVVRLDYTMEERNGQNNYSSDALSPVSDAHG